ncbi:MAG TPA: excinuclease ABC subunit UvrA, partial [Candidatus Omnitrophota bacterium]|nr:excinuclease ABC subunit UvrA [Candidatus Omnitrophota bacterium]
MGTVTEIYDYLRLLFARIGHPHCPVCGQEIAKQAPSQIVEEIQKLKPKGRKIPTRIILLAPVVRDRKGEFSQLFEDLTKKGYRYVRVDTQIRSLEEDFVLIKTNKHSVDVVVDKMTLPAERERLLTATEQALNLAEGTIIASEILDKTFAIPEYPKLFKDHLFSEKFACAKDNISLSEVEPRTFSFNSPHGACPACNGLGTIRRIDSELVINPNLSIAEGAILPWSRMIQSDGWASRTFLTVVSENHIPLDRPFASLPEKAKRIILEGDRQNVYRVRGLNRYGRMTSWETTFEGVIENLGRRYRETESDFVRSEIEKFMRIDQCETCRGSRLKPEALSITINQNSIDDITRLSIGAFYQWLNDLTEKGHKLEGKERIIAEPILKELTNRTHFLVDVGLDYLTVNRSAVSLAGGEAQRIRLASQIGSGLSGVLYVLDEPSIGLHPRDNWRLIETLKKLRDLQNTVIVVEHDRDMMLAADVIFDFGPKAGEGGGKIIAQGLPSEIEKNAGSLTGRYLAGKKTVNVPKNSTWKNQNGQDQLIIHGARQHNLKNIDVVFPLGKFICITGVSGSGKSTLVHEILYKALARHFWRSREKPGEHDYISGKENLNKIVLIDQSPIGRTPRSNPATYTGVFTFIRELFAKTTDARIRGYKPGRFSFNVKGGRCEACEGEG